MSPVHASMDSGGGYFLVDFEKEKKTHLSLGVRRDEQVEQKKFAETT